MTLSWRGCGSRTLDAFLRLEIDRVLHDIERPLLHFVENLAEIEAQYTHIREH